MGSILNKHRPIITPELINVRCHISWDKLHQKPDNFDEYFSNQFDISKLNNMDYWREFTDTPELAEIVVVKFRKIIELFLLKKKYSDIYTYNIMLYIPNNSIYNYISDILKTSI